MTQKEGVVVNDKDKMANDFLRRHDKDFTRKDRVKRTDRPYLSDRQLQLRRSREIPSSSIFNRSVAQCFGHDGGRNNE